MEPLIGALIGAGMLLAFFGRTRLRHGRGRADSYVPSEPASLVRLIESDEELRDAANRAAQFDRDAAQRLLNRAEHYEAAATSRSITHIRTGHRSISSGEAGEAPRSA